MGGAETRALAIGEFALRSGLSVKALRLYDVSGLLPPAEVDPVSGYRRYTVDQLERARRIRLLRQLDMPLAVVAEVLAGSDAEAVLRLDSWWAAQEAALQAKRGSFRWLRAELSDGVEPERPYPVLRRSAPATKVATIRAEVDQQGLVDAIRAGEWEIRCHLGAVETTDEHWVIYHGAVTTDSAGPIEVCVPFVGHLEPVANLSLRLEPVQSLVYTTVARDDCFFPRIMQAYDAVAGHVASARLTTDGPVREIYLAAWDRIDGTDPFVQVAQPVD